MSNLVDILTRAAQEPALNSATLRQFTTLIIVAKGNDSTMGELANTLNAPPPAVTRVVDMLEVAGFVQRNRSQKNRKIVYLTLTMKGEALVKRLVNYTSEEANVLE